MSLTAENVVEIIEFSLSSGCDWSSTTHNNGVWPVKLSSTTLGQKKRCHCFTVIGASLSEPHTSGTALRKCVNIQCSRASQPTFKNPH